MGRRELVPSLLRPKKGPRMHYRIIVVVAVMIMAFAVFSGTALADDPLDPGDGEPIGPVGSVDVPVLDTSYDDGWETDFPDTIGGYPVGYITTPKDQACTDEPMIYLRSSATSVDQFLANAPDVA